MKKRNKKADTVQKIGRFVKCAYQIDRPDEGKRIARFFLCCALSIGLLLTFLIPPLCGPDEQAHFVNAYAISTGDIFADPCGNDLAHWIPESFRSFMEKYPGTLIRTAEAPKYSYDELYEDSYFHSVNDETYPYATSIVSCGYLVSSAAMCLGRFLTQHIAGGVNAYNQMLMGRIGNLLFYAFVIYAAIKRSPRFKRTMMLLALMPMSLFQGCTLSYDAMLIPIAIYFIAVVLDFCSNEKLLKGKDIVLTCILSLLLVGIKIAYAPLLLLLLTIPKKKYGSTGRMAFCIALVVFSATVGYLPTYINGILEAQVQAGVETVENQMVTQQREWVVSHVNMIPSIFLSTLVARIKFYACSFWGQLGWLDTCFPFPIVVAGCLLLLIVSLYEASHYELWQTKRWKNFFPLLTLMISVFGIFLVMYINHTPLPQVTGEVGGKYIEGVQGRYLIPLFLPLLLSLSNPLLLRIGKLNTVQSGEKMTMISCIGGGTFALMTVVILLLRYWI